MEVLSGWFGFNGGEGCDRGMFERMLRLAMEESWWF